MKTENNAKKYRTAEDWLFYIGHGVMILLLIGWPLFLKYADGLALGCVFNQLTGYRCLACGGTRAFAAMLQGKLQMSFCYNPVVLYFFILYAWFMLSWYIQKLSRGKIAIGMRWRNLYVYIGLAILFLHCTIDNLMIWQGRTLL